MCDEKPGNSAHHNWLLHHKSLKTTQFMTNNMVIIPHPPYSLDITTCNFAVSHIENELKGRRFETVSDIQRVSQAVLDSIKENDVHSAFEAWKK
jgi:hypothetical protein